jgi:hypothetical protein
VTAGEAPGGVRPFSGAERGACWKLKAVFRDCGFRAINVKVSDGGEPPLTLYLSLSESAGSRSLDRRVRLSPDREYDPRTVEASRRFR